MPRAGATLLSDLTIDALIVPCDVCRRSGRYSVARLLAQRGDIRPTDFLSERKADCPKQNAGLFMDRCRARYDFSPEHCRALRILDFQSAL
jgi:hypothetical protein